MPPVIINNEPSLEDYVEVHCHGFSNNYMYVYNEDYGNMVKTKAYKNWLANFPTYELKSQEYWEKRKVDFDLPIRVYLGFICKKDTDIQNLQKSAIDMIFNRQLGIDDNCIDDFRLIRVGDCFTYEDGKIYYFIENITE